MSDTDRWYWLSSKSMTVGVTVKDGKITRAAPIVRRFIGQPLENLVRWMETQKDFRMKEIK